MRSLAALPLLAVVGVLAAPADINPALSNNSFVVSVGDGGYAYTPNTIVGAKPGDTILFEFRKGNHTVTQTSFADPCSPFINATTNTKGFDTGFMPFTEGSNELPFFQLKIMSTEPIWIACLQANHCQSGMVMAINPTADKTFEQFRDAAQGKTGTSSALARVATSSGWPALAGLGAMLMLLA
ncbi:hypothetical protein EXIGLDRAFT_720657 [Exidia glandulosa HHB12029]|uniref:Cupredoxin n=1 Tax=Exidia glandulosa HHB12029 TaxID=1314781 RepID=A0A165G784_EXIGL|nr:hypothetical protein EXIGLDRAFT_720657 [Exidia glandulosa HHB12029]